MFPHHQMIKNHWSRGKWRAGVNRCIPVISFAGGGFGKLLWQFLFHDGVFNYQVPTEQN